VKTSLVCQTFDEPEQLLKAITELLNEIQPPEVVAVLRHWAERVRWVLENNRDYYHEQIHLLGKHFLIHLPEPWCHYLLPPCSVCPVARPLEKVDHAAGDLNVRYHLEMAFSAFLLSGARHTSLHNF
jgi:hypothetical protein